MKRLLCLSLFLIMALLFLPPRALAAENTEKLIALTFDDGPWRFTEELLDGLAQRDAKVTFFMVGKYAALRPATVRRAWQDGLQIASHTWDHLYLATLGSEDIGWELGATDQTLDQAIGFDFDYLLRPPYGSYNEKTAAIANTPAIFWSMNTSDYKTVNSDVVYNQIIVAAKDGGICCLHDTHLSTVRGALRAIDTLQNQGYRCVTIAELFWRRGIELEAGKSYYSAYPGTTQQPLLPPEIHLEAAETELTLVIACDDRGNTYYTLDGTAPDPLTGKIYTS